MRYLLRRLGPVVVEVHESHAAVEMSDGLPGSIDPGTNHCSYVHFPACRVEVGSPCSRTFPEHDGDRQSAGTPRKGRGEVTRDEVLGLTLAFWDTIRRHPDSSHLVDTRTNSRLLWTEDRRFVGRIGTPTQGSYPRALRWKHHGEQHHRGAHDQRQPGDGPGYLLVLLIGGAYGKMGLAYPPPLLPDPLPGGAPLFNANHVSNERSENALASLSQNFGELPFHAIG